MDESNFKIGDEVKLISQAHGDSRNNPVWGGKHGLQKGKISSLYLYSEYLYEVIWESGSTNRYLIGDLSSLSPKQGHRLTQLFK